MDLKLRHIIGPTYIVILIFCLICSQDSLAYGLPEIKDSNLKMEQVISGIPLAIDMAFLAQDDILIAMKDSGEIKRIVNGSILPEPLLDLSVANVGERGLISVAVATNESKKFVFTYHTQAGSGEDGDDEDERKRIRPEGSFVYRFELMDNKLLNPKLLAYINTTSFKTFETVRQEAHHVGGKIIIGPDKYLYIIVGDGLDHRTQALNRRTGPTPDGTGGILRMTQDGKPAPDPPLGETFPINLYYAYGIRNSIAIDFDPVSGYLWDGEAGPHDSDELNLVLPGFNSGWRILMGMANAEPNATLINIGGRSTYMDPKLVWNSPVTPTAIKFLNTTNLGPGYTNDLLVSRYLLGATNNATLYHFDLSNNRTELLLTGELEDKVVNSLDEDMSNVLVSNLGIVTDMEIGPDGNLYLLQLSKPGAIYKISSINDEL